VQECLDLKRLFSSPTYKIYPQQLLRLRVQLVRELARVGASTDDLLFNQGRLSILKALENMPNEIERELEKFEEEEKKERKVEHGKSSIRRW
jgi:hypothetical protein